MTYWNYSKEFEDKANIAWERTFYTYFEGLIIGVVSLEKDLSVQKQHYDKLLYFEGDGEPKKVEIKTRQRKYFDTYKQDRLLAFEVMGNIERNDLGSSIYNTIADYWAYGFYLPDIQEDYIINPSIFYRKELAEYLKDNEYKYPKIKSNTNGHLYHTLFILVPFDDVKQFRIKQTKKF